VVDGLFIELMVDRRDLFAELVVDRPSTITHNRLLCTKLVVSRRVSFAEFVVAKVLSVELVATVLPADRPLTFTCTEPRPLASIEPRPPSDIASNVSSRLLCTQLAVSRQALFAELVVDGLFIELVVYRQDLFAELVVDRPHTITHNRLLCTKLVVSRRVSFAEPVVVKALSAELVVGRQLPPSKPRPLLGQLVVDSATPVYRRPSAEPGAVAGKSSGVRVETRVREFPRHAIERQNQASHFWPRCCEFGLERVARRCVLLLMTYVSASTLFQSNDQNILTLILLVQWLGTLEINF
jgi:hypothetical protein